MFGEIIDKYTRQQAIEDGVLIDLSDLAKEAGFKFPLAITAGVKAILNNLEAPGQSFEGRAWDMLTILKLESRRAAGDTVYFAPLFARKDRRCKEAEKYITEPIKMWSKCGPGDNMEPVITVMMPEED